MRMLGAWIFSTLMPASEIAFRAIFRSGVFMADRSRGQLSYILLFFFLPNSVMIPSLPWVLPRSGSIPKLGLIKFTDLLTRAQLISVKFNGVKVIIS
jgi:hypothetical protein